MRTTLEVDPDLLAEAMRVTDAPTKTAAVRLGLRSLVDQATRRRLAALRGEIRTAEAPRRRRTEVAGPTR